MTRLLALLFILAILVVGVVQSGVLTIRAESASFFNGSVELHGKLVVPRGADGPLPAVVVVHGSGRVRWKDLRGYARRLVPAGMAVLLYNKRGVGNSGGQYRTIGVADSDEELRRLASDVSAAVDFLATHPLVDPERIVLVGGSQAGWVMPLAVTMNPRVRAIVAISGPAVTYGQEILYSQLTGDDPGPYTDLTEAQIHAKMTEFEGPHGYDPRPVLDALTIPSLWILGGADRSVPTWLSVEALEAVRDLGGSDLTVTVHPKGDHSLRSARGRRIDYWPDVRSWLASHGLLGAE